MKKPHKNHSKYPSNSQDDKQNPYDLEININSILGFLKGWDIIFGKDGKKKYEKAIEKIGKKLFQL